MAHDLAEAEAALPWQTANERTLEDKAVRAEAAAQGDHGYTGKWYVLCVIRLAQRPHSNHELSAPCTGLFAMGLDQMCRSFYVSLGRYASAYTVAHVVNQLP